MTPEQHIIKEVSHVHGLFYSIGVLTVYVLIKDVLPKILGKPNGKDFMTTQQHDKECALKLRPIWKKLDEMHKDVKELLARHG